MPVATAHAKHPPAKRIMAMAFWRVNSKEIFSVSLETAQGPGLFNKRIRSWLRTIYPYSLGILWIASIWLAKLYFRIPRNVTVLTDEPVW